MRFEQYRYLWPPRPETATAPANLRFYEAQGWWAQAKLNGTCTTLYVPPVGGTIAMGRHGPEHRLKWQPGDRWEQFRRRLPNGQWFVFVGELLHTRGVGITDTVYLFDILVDRGEYLVGQTYAERWRRLSRLCDAHPYPKEGTHSVVTPGVWVAANHATGYAAWPEAIRSSPAKSAIEGIVLKKPNAELRPCGSASANARWQHKWRRPTDHLSF